jgi:hypothetical protein
MTLVKAAKFAKAKRKQYTGEVKGVLANTNIAAIQQFIQLVCGLPDSSEEELM